MLLLSSLLFCFGLLAGGRVVEVASICCSIKARRFFVFGFPAGDLGVGSKPVMGRGVSRASLAVCRCAGQCSWEVTTANTVQNKNKVLVASSVLEEQFYVRFVHRLFLL